MPWKEISWLTARYKIIPPCSAFLETIDFKCPKLHALNSPSQLLEKFFMFSVMVLGFLQPWMDTKRCQSYTVMKSSFLTPYCKSNAFVISIVWACVQTHLPSHTEYLFYIKSLDYSQPRLPNALELYYHYPLLNMGWHYNISVRNNEEINVE